MVRKKVTENRLWSCKAKEPINKNLPFTILQLFLFDTPPAPVGVHERSSHSHPPSGHMPGEICVLSSSWELR